jgi:hypothetical protein
LVCGFGYLRIDRTPQLGHFYDWVELVVTKLLERIKASVIEEGDCWEWQGALQWTGSTPMINFEGKVQSVRRFIADEKGLPRGGNRVATMSCGNALCVHPDHVVVMTRKKLQQRIANEQEHQINPMRRKKISELARSRSKLNYELAMEIRYGEGTQREKAKRHGVSQATVSSIMLGKTWQDYNSPFLQLFQTKTK